LSDIEFGAAVEFVTGVGVFTVSADLKRAPRSGAYFLRDVDDGIYDGTSIFRIVKSSQRPPKRSPIEVVQMGRFSLDELLAPSIPHETTSMTGLRHLTATVSLARFAPGAVYHSFFVCMRDEPSLDAGGLRNPDGQGFAAFGSVIDGFDRIETMFREWVSDDEYLDSPVPILSARRSRTACGSGTI